MGFDVTGQTDPDCKSGDPSRNHSRRERKLCLLDKKSSDSSQLAFAPTATSSKNTSLTAPSTPLPAGSRFPLRGSHYSYHSCSSPCPGSDHPPDCYCPPPCHSGYRCVTQPCRLRRAWSSQTFPFWLLPWCRHGVVGRPARCHLLVSADFSAIPSNLYVPSPPGAFS